MNFLNLIVKLNSKTFFIQYDNRNIQYENNDILDKHKIHKDKNCEDKN